MAVFRKVLTNTDVERRLSVPTFDLKALPPLVGGHAVNLPVKDDETGKVWTFQCSNRGGVYPKPVIFAGWLQYVHSKDLKIGDIVNFYREVDQATGAQYKIEVKRVTKEIQLKKELIFTKVLTNNDLERRLMVPAACLKDVLPLEGGHAVNLRVKDEETGQVWTFQCSIRAGVYPKPVIFAGWLQFVRSKDLQIGHIINLYSEVDQATGAQYKIEVKRMPREINF